MANLLRFPGMPSEEGGLARLAAEREPRLAPAPEHKTYAYFWLEWADEADWWGYAREGPAGCYAMCVADLLCAADPRPPAFVPDRQPKDPVEAVAALRAEAARMVAERGEPHIRRFIVVPDGSNDKLVALRRRADHERERLAAEMLVLGRWSLLKRLWFPLWQRRWRRLMQKEWSA